jgi:hypothetical protein
VEGLRIELTGKCFDLLLINDVGSACEVLPDVEIVEIEPIVAAEFRHDRCLWSGPVRLEGTSSLRFSKTDAARRTPAQYSRFAQGIRDPIDLLIEHDADLLQLRPLKRSEK